MITYTKKSIDENFIDILITKDSLPEIMTELQSNISDEQTLLTELTNDSAVARWVLYAYTVATTQDALETSISNFVSEVNTAISAIFYGTPKWYIQKTLEFQYGDVLLENEFGNYYYETINEGNRIIRSCTVELINGATILKVRGKDSDILTVDQMESLFSYLVKLQTNNNINIRNENGDRLKIIANVRYNGQNEITTIKSKVEEAINSYISDIDFDSIFVRTNLIDTVKKVDGVLDFEINTLESRSFNVEIFTPIVHNAISGAGYFVVDENYPLSTFITYQIK